MDFSSHQVQRLSWELIKVIVNVRNFKCMVTCITVHEIPVSRQHVLKIIASPSYAPDNLNGPWGYIVPGLSRVMGSNNAIRILFSAAVLAGAATATKENQPPCPYPYTPFVYSGCFADARSARTLSYGPGVDYGTSTIETCTAACKGNGFKYAGLEYYGECFCGSTIAGSTAPEADCNLPCKGNQNQTCGGFDRLSIYQDPTFSATVANSGDYISLGCYTEGNGGRAFGTNLGSDILDPSKMTNELCKNACGSKGYPYAATEWSRECYCGIRIDNNATTAPTGDCKDICLGDSSQTCGGDQRLNVFLANSLLSSQPCGPPRPPGPSSASTVSSSTSTYTPPPPTSKTSSSTSSTTSSTPTSTTQPSKTSSTVSSTSTSWTRTWSSTLWTSSTISIPSNSYTPPPYTPTQSSKPPPAPTPSCICATPAPWSGTKCVANIPLPCVGCNENKSQRSQFPFKLFNHDDLSRCKSYKPTEPRNACFDACKTQWQWCRNYAETVKGKHHARHNHRHDKHGKHGKHGNKDKHNKNENKNENRRYEELKAQCDRQYSDCYKVNGDINGDGRCKADKQKQEWESKGWYDWLSRWLGQWGFRG
ncbi:WSC domain-containing protein [Dendryphion nanum]|uniref:WSC domain-containing protein n=1 Tax=Dendryphion nanum TaxID=256645 RepID=A0A9P9DG16_9PLEO|nr:WSC domain-containing protein [Dendryphion nanum]